MAGIPIEVNFPHTGARLCGAWRLKELFFNDFWIFWFESATRLLRNPVCARFVFMFKPGSYDVEVPVGYYTQVLGLGALPNEVIFTSSKGVYSEELL